MPKVVPGPEGGYPDAPFVRMAVRKGVVTHKILAIQHPLVGWLKPWAYKAVVAIEGLIKRIDPIKGIAFVGLTITYKQTIESAEDALVWFNDLMKELGFTIPGIPGISPQVDVPGQILLGLGPIGWLVGWLLPQAGAEGPTTEELTEAFDKWNVEIVQWFTAITAAAVTIVLGPSVIGAISPL